MAHFAELDENNIVVRVLVIDQETLNTGAWGDPSLWVQTSYNTHGGVYHDPDTGQPAADQSKALRKNFAGIGYTYDAALDAFIPPRYNPTFVLDENSGTWVPPVPYPDDGRHYEWDDQNGVWVAKQILTNFPLSAL